MGARRNRTRGGSRTQGLPKKASLDEIGEVTKEDGQDGCRYNVDFQELNEELSVIDSKDENAKDLLDVVEDSKLEKETCVDDGVGCIEKIDVGRITNEEDFRISEDGGLDVQDPSPVGADSMHGLLYPVTQNTSAIVIPQTPKRKVLHEEGSHLSVKEENTISSRMIINRYPGHLFVHIDQVERFMTSRSNIGSVSIRIESEVISYETKRYRPWDDIRINEMLRIPIRKVEGPGIRLRFVLLLHHVPMGTSSGEEAIKACETTLVIDVNKIHSIHNNLLESVLIWDEYSSRNIFKNIRSFFTSGTPDAWSLKTYLSFVSDDEVRLIPAPLPNDLKSLSKWLVVKKFSYSTWFKGFVNIRGDLGEICTNLWKRRYVKCYGYMIFVFNEHSRSLVGTVNLVDASFDPISSSKIYLENFLSIEVGQNVVELHFDAKEKYNMCKNALSTMLPRALFCRRE